jgi:hypothetical protein
VNAPITLNISDLITTNTVILSYGMGVDSTAILLRWLEDPSSRDFDLKDLIVLTAHTGDEYPDTKRDVEAHVLPRLRAAGVRFVQVARGGPYEKDGIVVLSDSTTPTTLHTEGAYKLSDELMTAGTVPARRGTQKLCTQKFKGWVLDQWVMGELKGKPFRHVVGFESEETERVEKDQGYTRLARKASYPLVEWNWNRAKCIEYIQGVTGIAWKKSACVQCPFASLKGSGCVDRFRENPESAAKALAIEYMSLVLNPRMGIFGDRTLRQVVENSDNPQAIATFQKRLDDQKTWAVYRVRRAYVGKAKASRELTTIFTGTREEAKQKLLEMNLGFAEVDKHGILRAYRERRVENVYPAREEMLVLGPAGVPDKVERTTFDRRWNAQAA